MCVGVRQSDLRKFAAEGRGHEIAILKALSATVNMNGASVKTNSC